MCYTIIYVFYVTFYQEHVHTSFREGAVTMAKKSNTGIPGLSVNFSWKRALGITAAKQKFARKTGIPTTKAGLERKIGRAVLDMLNPKK